MLIQIVCRASLYIRKGDSVASSCANIEERSKAKTKTLLSRSRVQRPSRLPQLDPRSALTGTPFSARLINIIQTAANGTFTCRLFQLVPRDPRERRCCPDTMVQAVGCWDRKGPDYVV